MCRQLFLFLLALSFCPHSSRAANQDTIPPFFGISVIPALNWNVIIINDAKDYNLDYQFDLNSFTSFEGNVRIPKIGLKVGLSAQVDNNVVGKAYQLGGYLGFKNYWVRIQRSLLSGRATWDGPTPDGFNGQFNFSKNHYTIELLKTAKKKRYIDGKWVLDPIENQMGFYWGVGYTSMGIPLKFCTLTTPGGRVNQQFGVSAFDTLFTAKYYTMAAGFDLLRNLSLTGGKSGLVPGIPPKKFAVYASTSDKFGFGSSQISDFGIALAENLNPGYTFVNPKSFSVMVHYSLSVGFRYLITAKPVFIIFASGYDLEGAAIVSYGGAADTNLDLGYDANFFYFYHGISFKLLISWIGK